MSAGDGGVLLEHEGLRRMKGKQGRKKRANWTTYLEWCYLK